jgi:RNA polymerase sigma-70 factor (ECF subfamily)
MSSPAARASARPLDSDSQEWLDALRSAGHEREDAIARLHALMLRAARFEVARRGAQAAPLTSADLDELAQQSADDATIAVLAKLDSFKGQSRFTTWAYKFALLEAAVKLRRRAWEGRELPLEPDGWPVVSDPRGSPQATAEHHALLSELKRSIQCDLTPHQREIVVALALNEVPIDVLAERLRTTRGALYKTLHDARRKLRRALTAAGYPVGDGEEANDVR